MEMSVNAMEQAILSYWRTERSPDSHRLNYIQEIANQLSMTPAGDESLALRIHSAALVLERLLSAIKQPTPRALMTAIGELEETAGEDVDDWPIVDEALERFAELTM
jgi:hypothetical protein